MSSEVHHRDLVIAADHLDASADANRFGSRLDRTEDREPLTVRGGLSAVDRGQSMNLIEIAACTMSAAHRRDHRHAISAGSCHPHAIEVIHLGTRGVAVCHDCGADSGFVPTRHAMRVAAEHQQETRSASVMLRQVAPA